MAEAEVMVKDATPKKVMALASRKYSRDDKIQKDQEELDKLIAENKGEVTEEVQEEPEPTSAEEKTFKKRYGDLRRHTQQKEADLQEQINQLREVFYLYLTLCSLNQIFQEVCFWSWLKK